MTLELVPGSRFTLTDGSSILAHKNRELRDQHHGSVSSQQGGSDLVMRLSSVLRGLKTSDGNLRQAAQEEPKARAGNSEANIRAEERRRIATVFASEHVKGRETAAGELLASSGMSAERIVAMLPKLGASSRGGVAAVLRAMRDGNSDRSGERRMGDHGWGKAVARHNPRKSETADQSDHRDNSNHGWGRAVSEVNRRNQPGR